MVTNRWQALDAVQARKETYTPITALSYAAKGKQVLWRSDTFAAELDIVKWKLRH